MEKVRIGNDIQVKYTVLRDGQPESFVGATNIVVTVKNEAYGKVIPSTFNIVGNIVNISIDAADFNLCGKYRVTLKYVRGNDIEIDALAFEGVQYTSLTGGTEIVGVEIVTVNISGDIGIAIPDNNKIDLNGLNSDIQRLQFDTVNPVAGAQAGQVYWSDEEKTLVLNDGYHTHPIGKELGPLVKNNSGQTILNGQACYVIGSTGDNPTIGLASTANGDVAQKTIGLATMDIPNNGFGIVTTFGEVNDINTSALTQGGLIYLGLNGTLTTTEPIAPTPKIIVGICVRQHAVVGKIFVATRPIPRLSKLSDVYTTTMADGEVLRWNTTTLRFEAFNVTTALAGKADLVGGKVPTSQLPSYVDDVLEYANLAAFPATGETGKIYVALNTNLTYRWGGTAYVEISKSLALGETSDTAYRGDRGKTAYDHSQTTGNPHNTTAAQIQNTPAGTVAATTVQGAINELAGDIVQVETDLNEKLENSKNLFNPNDANILYGKGYNLNTSTIIDASVYNIYTGLRGSQGQKVFISVNSQNVSKVGFYKVVAYNQLGQWISTQGYNLLGVTLPANTYTFNVQYHNNPVGLLQIEIGESITYYQAYYPTRVKRINLPKTLSSAIIGKRWTSFGNSITFQNKWQPLVAAYHDLIHTNLGVSSTTMAFVASRETDYPCFVNESRIQAIKDSNPDIITIMGGTNDSHLEVPVGTSSELTKTTATKDKTVFYGAYSYLIETLLTWKPSLRIVLMSTQQGIYDVSHPYKYKDYADATKAISQYYSLPCADIFGESGISKFNMAAYSSDLIHPNDEGGKLIAAIVAETMKKVFKF